MTADDGSSMAQARVHDGIRLDLLEADAKALSNTLQRQVVRPFCDLNFAPGRAYPRLVLVVPQPEDTKLLVEALTKLVPLGLEVEQSVVRDKLNLPDPDKGAKLLTSTAAPTIAPALAQASNREQPTKPAQPLDIVDNQVRTLEQSAGVYIDDMVDEIRELLDSVSSLEEFRDRLIEAYPEMSTGQLADAMADGLAAASLAGRYDVLRGL
jgi:phage gp29-like protein